MNPRTCILIVKTNGGHTYKDTRASVIDITKNTFTASTLIKGKQESIDHISINFFEGNGTHISISGKPVDIEEKDERIQYVCYFKHSIGAIKHLNIHKSKRVPTQKGKNA